jgi:hypothetical protein
MGPLVGAVAPRVGGAGAGRASGAACRSRAPEPIDASPGCERRSDGPRRACSGRGGGADVARHRTTASSAVAAVDPRGTHALAGRPEQASAPAVRTRPHPCGRSSAPVHRSHPGVVLEDLCANDLRDASGTIGDCLVRDDREPPGRISTSVSRCRAILRCRRVSCRRQRFAGGRERGPRTSRRS